MITLVTGETDGCTGTRSSSETVPVLEEIKCHGKLAAKREEGRQEETPDEKEPCGPVKWLGVHHNFSGSPFEVSQPEKMWINQLEARGMSLCSSTPLQG